MAICALQLHVIDYAIIEGPTINVLVARAYRGCAFQGLSFLLFGIPEPQTPNPKYMFEVCDDSKCNFVVWMAFVSNLCA